jgi:hypothetical protein
MSRIVASTVAFLTGTTAAGDELLLGVGLGLLLAVDGEDDFFGEGDVSVLGVGLVFCVVTETVGSDAVASGEAAGEGLSSCARANDMAAAKKVVRATSVIFIWFFCFGLLQTLGEASPWSV